MKAVRIDAQGFYIEDLPAYTGPQTKDIILQPTPEGLYKPKWNGTAWIEGLTPAEIAARQVPVGPDYLGLKTALTPFYAKYSAVAAVNPSVAFFLNAFDVEINSPIPTEANLKNKLSQLLLSLKAVLTVDKVALSADVVAVNKSLLQFGFGFQLPS